MNRALTIARREYLTTVKRRAFLFTVIFMPLYFGFIMTFTSKFATSESRRSLRETTKVGVVDSTGLFANVPKRIVTESGESEAQQAMEKSQQRQPPPAGRTTPALVNTEVEMFADYTAGERALRAESIKQLLVIPPDYVQTGKLRRYVLRQGIFTSVSDRLFGRWISAGLLHQRVDSSLVERIVRPTKSADLFTLDRVSDQFQLYDDRKEWFSIFLPIIITGLLATSIITGGQYLLQGVSEERESRILESLLCTVSTDDIMVGKLIGLGGAGLTLVATWSLVGAYFGGPMIALANAQLPWTLLAFGAIYFLLGYTFYASIMTAIGAITTNLREAQQFALVFTFSLFVPYIVMWVILERPEGTLARVLSFIPLTAPTTMLMRLATGYGVPLWELALSIGIMLVSAWLAISAGSRVFRIGLLLYGKTPNLPEIMKWAFSKN